MRAVRREPLRPASGLVLIATVTARLGSSTTISGSGRGSSGSAMVSPIITSSRPATAMISPGPARSAGTRSRPSATSSSVSRIDVSVPSRRHQATADPRAISPWRTRHRASRPRYGDESRFATWAWKGCPGSKVGAGMCETISSSSGRIVSPATSGSRVAVPSRAFVYTMGKSICDSSASSSKKSAYTSSTTSAMRASGRSILFTTRITGSRPWSALRSTNRVCGSGPSLASTSSSTPSTIESPRSTSPPKSAWPGVSMMLIFVSPKRTAVFLARIVMPRSRSSPASMTRSTASSWAANVPDWRRSASTSVVLPWSTWAMIAMLRMSARACMSPGRVATTALPRARARSATHGRALRGTSPPPPLRASSRAAPADARWERCGRP